MDKVRVLVIEDEVSVAGLMAELLTRVDCVVQVATNGLRGLEMATEEHFDLITLDVGLPDIDGFEICRELKQRHVSYRTPIIFVAAHSAAESRRRALDVGARDFIEKPFQVEDFIARVGKVVNRNFKVSGVIANDTKI